MFIHRIIQTGCGDRGAWPWRTCHFSHAWGVAGRLATALPSARTLAAGSATPPLFSSMPSRSPRVHPGPGLRGVLN